MQHLSVSTHSLRFTLLNFLFLAWHIQILSNAGWLLNVAHWRVRSPLPNLMSSSPRRSKIWATMKASMRWWCRGMNGGAISININLHSLNSNLSCSPSWWLPPNKNCMVEMVQFLVKLCKSDQTKWQNGCRWCVSESNLGRSGVAGFCGKGDGGSGDWNHHGGEYCFVIYFLAHVETDILLYVMSCNVTVLQLNWYSFHPGLDGRCDPEDSHGYLTGLKGVHKWLNQQGRN